MKHKSTCWGSYHGCQ